ncbi:MAG TPA: glycosyltransferase family 4 protein [Chloroflexota bacterium]|nr:glycosyltransferase family 4 protein [Chloroflexota bacterium]HUM68762.1 glycosyltransferase family 4 protein [Chloroflexota bacterium]
MTTPKVCIFTETYYPVVGGGETQARLLAEGLAAEGTAVIILTRRSDASLPKVEHFGAVTVYRLPPVGRGQLKKWGLLFSSAPRLIQLRRQYDLIFVSGFRIVGVTAVLIGKLLGKTVVLKADSQGEMSGEFFTAGLSKRRLSPTSLPFTLFLRGRNAILKRADAFTAITRETAVEMANAGIQPDVIHMIPNSVDTGRFFPVDAQQKAHLRRELGLPPDGKFVIYTGRLVSYKGLPLLLKVWQEIQRQHQDAKLLLVGTGGLDIHNCEADLQEFVSATGLQESVIFTGSVQNVPDYLQASDIFVLPTEDDAFPSSLIEAMTCRLAAISTPVGAISTIIKNEQNGLLVQPGDFQQLYATLDRLLTDAGLAARLGQAGWQTVQERYTADIVNRQYRELFCEATRPLPEQTSQVELR